MPFLDDVSIWTASSHLCSGTLERSKTVPTVTVNCWRQAPQNHRPGRALSPLMRLALSTTPQCGQIGPCGQRTASRCLRAAFSVLKRGAVMSVMVHPLDEPILSDTLHLSST